MVISSVCLTPLSRKADGWLGEQRSSERWHICAANFSNFFNCTRVKASKRNRSTRVREKKYLWSRFLPRLIESWQPAMDILLGSGRFLARRPPLALVPRCSRGSPDKSGSDKGKRSELLIAVTVKFFGGYRTSVWWNAAVDYVPD